VEGENSTIKARRGPSEVEYRKRGVQGKGGRCRRNGVAEKKKKLIVAKKTARREEEIENGDRCGKENDSGGGAVNFIS